MPNIFNYLNYREYLEDFYLEKKRENSSFSFQVFANMVGFNSKSFIKLVIDDKKNLSESSIEKLNNILKLNEKSFSYFKDLVAFNQAKTLEMKNLFFEKITQYNKRSKSTLILQNQYEFYSKWYNNTLRELVCCVDFKEDYAILGKMVKPAISARKARLAVKNLLKLGFIKKTGDIYTQFDSVITTGDEVESLAIHNFHLQNMAIAGASLDSCKSNERDISSLILGLSNEGISLVKKEIQNFRKKILDIAEKEKFIDQIYHLNFQLFPTSEVIDAKNSK